jgi:hypothetical protein
VGLFADPVFVLVNLGYPFCERIVSVFKDGIVVQLYPLSTLLDLQHSVRFQIRTLSCCKKDMNCFSSQILLSLN